MFREGPTYQRRGSLQLWQFLVALLDDPSNSHFIAWTGRGMEFKLIEPEEVSMAVCNKLPIHASLFWRSGVFKKHFLSIQTPVNGIKELIFF